MFVCRSLSLPDKSFGISAFLLTVFQHFASGKGRSLGLQGFRAWPRESYWTTWPRWNQLLRKWRQLQAAQTVSWPGHRQSCSQGDKHPSTTCGHHNSFRKVSHVPRVSGTAYWHTSPSIILLYVFKIILCNAPRMSELLYELSSLHIFHLISGNSDRQGAWPYLSMDLSGRVQGHSLLLVNSQCPSDSPSHPLQPLSSLTFFTINIKKKITLLKLQVTH